MPAMPETVLGAVDTKISTHKTQSLPSSCLHSNVTNMPETDECNEMMKKDMRCIGNQGRVFQVIVL